jgi:hypothetical protein
MKSFDNKVAQMTAPETRELLGAVASVWDSNGLSA